jgi:hypothetical protein
MEKTTKDSLRIPVAATTIYSSLVFCRIKVKDGLDDPGFKSKYGQEIFLFSKLSRPALDPFKPPTQ